MVTRRLFLPVIFVLLLAGGTAQWAVVHHWGYEPLQCITRTGFPMPICDAPQASESAVASAAAKGGGVGLGVLMLLHGVARGARRR
jgi:hypothetical protein